MAVATQIIIFASITGVPDLAFLGGIGSTEILMILVVMLLLFGPKQLPELAKTIGTALRGIRKATDDMKEEIGLDDFVNPRTRRTRNPRPGPNVPPSLEEGAGPPAGTRQISEKDMEKAFAARPSSPNPIPEQTAVPATSPEPATASAPLPDADVELPNAQPESNQPEKQHTEEPGS